METSRVREREDDRPINMRSHFFDNFFGEGFRLSGGADENVGFDFFDDGEEI